MHISPHGLLITLQLRHAEDARRAVQDVLAACEEDGWEASIDALRQRMHWEYEGM